MPKREVPPPEPQSQYEGYRWLRSDWGRSGKPKPSRIGGYVMAVAALIVFGVAITATTWDRPLFVLVSVIVGALCAAASWFLFVEAHFADRASREQRPFTPST
ncbi:hypothetical protein [Demequina sp.]|uniref:hypothetical protein n=1 Tax=Demequina sp. TaxID=2050685 RepID=UPI003D0F5A32